MAIGADLHHANRLHTANHDEALGIMPMYCICQCQVYRFCQILRQLTRSHRLGLMYDGTFVPFIIQPSTKETQCQKNCLKYRTSPVPNLELGQLVATSAKCAFVIDSGRHSIKPASSHVLEIGAIWIQKIGTRTTAHWSKALACFRDTSQCKVFASGSSLNGTEA